MRITRKLYDLKVAFHNKITGGRPKKESKPVTRKIKEKLFLAVLFAYPLAQFFVFYVVVNFNSVMLAFKTYNPADGTYLFSGLNNFKRVFYDLSHDSMLLSGLGRGMIFYLASTIIGVPVHLMVAYLLYKKIRGANFFRTVLFFPSLIASIAMVIMFKYFVAYGIPEILTKVFKVAEENVPNFFMDTNIAFPLMIFYGLWIGVASGMVIYMSAMSRIPDSIIEFGQLEGITLFREFRSVILPMIYPTVSLFLVTGLAGLFTSSGPVYAFYGDHAQEKLQTLGYYLFTRVIGENSSFEAYPYASAIGLLLTAVTAPIIFGARWLFNKFDPDIEY